MLLDEQQLNEKENSCIGQDDCISGERFFKWFSGYEYREISCLNECPMSDLDLLGRYESDRTIYICEKEIADSTKKARTQLDVLNRDKVSALASLRQLVRLHEHIHAIIDQVAFYTDRAFSGNAPAPDKYVEEALDEYIVFLAIEGDYEARRGASYEHIGMMSDMFNWLNEKRPIYSRYVDIKIEVETLLKGTAWEIWSKSFGKLKIIVPTMIYLFKSRGITSMESYLGVLDRHLIEELDRCQGSILKRLYEKERDKDVQDLIKRYST